MHKQMLLASFTNGFLYRKFIIVHEESILERLVKIAMRYHEHGHKQIRIVDLETKDIYSFPDLGK